MWCEQFYKNSCGGRIYKHIAQVQSSCNRMPNIKFIHLDVVNWGALKHNGVAFVTWSAPNGQLSYRGCTKSTDVLTLHLLIQ
jgi:hypothetical protein